MTTPAVLRITGGKELRAGLKRAESELEDFKSTHLQVAGVVADAAHTVAPIGVSHRTVGSIRPGATQRAAIVRVGRANLLYPAVDHYGSYKQNIQPNPWLIDIAHETEPQWFPIYIKYVDHVIDAI